jgi:hypothetical protein
VIKAEHDLPGTERGSGEESGGGGQGEEMTQIMYAHVNKKMKKKKIKMVNVHVITTINKKATKNCWL